VKVYIGIDPGLFGAVATISADGRLLGVVDTPTEVVRKNRKNRRQYLSGRMLTHLQQQIAWASEIRIGIEHVSAMPGQGVHSMFLMGYGFGLWHGLAIAASGVEVSRVTPQSWRKEFGLRKVAKDSNRKARSVVLAKKLFPEAKQFLTLKKHDGRAEAILIAEYFRRKGEQ